MSDAGHFLLAICQPGAERALKVELARRRPELHPAFGRPGLVTFKSPAAVGPDFALEAVFARAYAASLGPAADLDQVRAAVRRLRPTRPLRLHVFPREASSDAAARPTGAEAPVAEAPDDQAPGAEAPVAEAPDDQGPGAEVPVAEAPGGEAPAQPEAAADRIRRDLLADPEVSFAAGEVAEPGDHVLDVVVAPGEPLWLGHHLHSPLHSPYPGGRIPIEVPPEAPSRAYRKLEEALVWSRAPLHQGQIAVEIGSAPGGASYALVRRGLEVVGVDPGDMAQVVLASPRFRHLRTTVGDVRREALPPRVDWLLLDVNLAPQVALHAIRRLVAALRPALRGVLFTLKLNDWAMAAKVPDLLRRLEEMGLAEVRATQLPSNRQEIFAYGVVRAEAPERKISKGSRRR